MFVLSNLLLSYDTLEAFYLVKFIILFFMVWFYFMDISSSTFTLWQNNELGLVSRLGLFFRENFLLLFNF